MSCFAHVFRISIVLSGLLAPWASPAQEAPAVAASTAAPARDAHAAHGAHDAKSAKAVHDMAMPMHAAGTGDAAAPAMPSMRTMPSMQMMPSTQQKPSMSQTNSQPSAHAMDMGSMQGGSPPAGARDPDYSDGISYPRDHDAHMHGDTRLGMLAIDRLEYVHTVDGGSGALEGQAWYGGDIDKATLKFEGESSGGRVTDARVEALWSHAVSAYWDAQLGVRHDGGEGPSREWAAIGVQGLAPYWFDVQASLYAGANGRSAARLDIEYDVLFTQRLVLTPKLELNAYGKDDPARGIGHGVSDASFGMRLRYAIRRRFAPYVGVTWSRRFGATAQLARDRGENPSSFAWVAGVRVWW